MSFNKKYINKEVLMEEFRLKGYQGVIDYIGNADVLVGLDDEIQQILDISFCKGCETKKNIQIEKLVYGN